MSGRPGWTPIAAGAGRRGHRYEGERRRRAAARHKDANAYKRVLKGLIVQVGLRCVGLSSGPGGGGAVGSQEGLRRGAAETRTGHPGT
jgi:hypothetical protein